MLVLVSPLFSKVPRSIFLTKGLPEIGQGPSLNVGQACGKKRFLVFFNVIANFSSSQTLLPKLQLDKALDSQKAVSRWHM